MAVGSIVQLVSVGANAASSTTVTGSIINVPTVGNHLLLIARSNGSTLSSVSDGVSTWQVDRNGNLSSLASALISGSLSGATFTLTYAGATTGKAFEIWEAAGLDQSSWYSSGGDAVRVSQGTARNFGSNIVTPTKIGDLLIAGWSATLSTETALTPASGYTVLPGPSGADFYQVGAATQWLEGVWRAAASTAAQEPTGTGGASPSAYRAIAGVYLAAAVTRSITFASTDVDAVAFTVGVLRPRAFPTTDVDTVSFTVGALRPRAFPTTDVDAVAFTVGVLRPRAFPTSDTDTVSFTVDRERPVAFPTVDVDAATWVISTTGPIDFPTTDTDICTFMIGATVAVSFGTIDVDVVTFGLNVAHPSAGLEMFMTNQDGRFVPTLTPFPDSFLPIQ